MQLILTSVILFFLPICLSIISTNAFFIFILATGGIPLKLSMPDRAVLLLFEGMGPSAIKLFGSMFGALFVIAIRSRNWIPHLLRYGPHIMFVFFCCISLLWCPNYIFGLRMLAKIVAPLIFLLALGASFSGKSHFKALEKAVFVSCILLLLFALTNHFLGYAGDERTFSYRNRSVLTAPYVSPAPFSFHISCGALLALVNFLSEGRKRYLVLFAIFSLTVFWAFTRISMAALVISSSICILMLTRSKAGKVLLPVLICLIFAISIFSSDRLRSRTFKNPDNVSISSTLLKPGATIKQLHTSGRTKLWSAALEKFFYENKIIGSGIGATQHWLYGEHKRRTGVVHSEYLRMLCEVGIFGLFLFLVAMFSYGFLLLKIYNHARTQIAKKYSTLGLAGLVFYLITLATDNSLDYVLYLGYYTFCFIGLAFLAHDAKRTTFAHR